MKKNIPMGSGGNAHQARCCELIAVGVVVVTLLLALPADVAIARCPLSVVHCLLFVVCCLSSLFVVHRSAFVVLSSVVLRCPLSVVLVTWQRPGWRGYVVAVDVAVSTCEPPCEQRLAAVGQVFMLPFIRSWCSLLAL
jgi:hypothetical protein